MDLENPGGAFCIAKQAKKVLRKKYNLNTVKSLRGSLVLKC